MLWHDWRIRYAAPILVAFCSPAAVFGQAPRRSLSPTSLFPAFMSAEPIFQLSLFVLSIAAAIFVVVFAVLAYSLVKFRRRLEDNGREHPQVYGGNQAGL